jgi:ribonuclease-3
MTEPSQTDTSVDRTNQEWLSHAQGSLGHRFADKTLLIAAFTHASRAGPQTNYERLEFLGDRILGLVLTDYLVRYFPHADQGELTKRYHDLSNEAALAQVCQRLGLQSLILHGPLQKGLTERESIQSDVIEAVIAALYLDGGLHVSRHFILTNWIIPKHLPTQAETNPKSELQEWAASERCELPLYHLVEQRGSAHEPEFKIAVSIKGVGRCTGEGRSHKQAEREAARQFLRRYVRIDKGQINA